MSQSSHSPALRWAALLGPLALCPVGAAQTASEQAVILSPRMEHGAAFGLGITTWGDRALISTPGANSAGEVFVYGPDLGGTSSWGQVTQLQPQGLYLGGFGPQFGGSMALEQDRALIGAKADGVLEEGSAYLFERDQGGPEAWGQVVRLQASDAELADHFGESVALSGDTAAISAPLWDVSAGLYNTGAVYVFDREPGGTWTETAILQASNPSVSASFGRAVAIDGDRIVGTSYDGDGYIFEPGPGSEWREEAMLIPDEFVGTSFGVAVALVGDLVAVGASRDDNGTFSDTGAVYLFQRDQGGPGAWGQVAKLNASDAQPGDRFGESLSLSPSAGQLIVGAPDDDHAGGVDAGSAYLFARDSGGGWTEVDKLTASVSADSDGFGHGVSIWGTTVFAGAPYTDLGPAFAKVAALAYDPTTGDLFAVDSFHDMLVRMEAQSGIASSVGYLGVDGIDGLAFDPVSQTLYGLATATDELVTIDLQDATVTVVGPLGFSKGQGLAFDSVNGILYATHKVSFVDVDLVSIDPLTGAGTTVGTTGFTDLQGLAYDTDTQTLYAVTEVTRRLITVDVATGLGTDVGSTAFSLTALTSLPGMSSLHGGQNDRLYLVDEATGVTTTHANITIPQDTGEARVYELLDPAVSYCTAGSSASGCAATLSALGTPSASAPTGFIVSAQDVEGDKDGLYFFGTNGQQANPWGNGTSFQCVVPPVSRAGLLTGTGTGGACDGTFAQDLNARWCPSCPKPGQNPGAGAVVQAQLWYRDPQNTSNQTTSLSNALEFTVCP